MTRAEALAKLKQARLYGILDTSYSNPQQWPIIAEQLIQGGVQILQIRAKNAEPSQIVDWAYPVAGLCEALQIPLIINDHPELVQEIPAMGCHVGQDDISVAEARKLAGDDALVGKSTHSLQQAIDAECEFPDYIGVGPIFTTPTKPDYVPVGLSLIHQVSSEVAIPQFCIGGIKLENLPTVIANGAKRVVIVSGLLLTKEPKKYAQEVRAMLDEVPLNP